MDLDQLRREAERGSVVSQGILGMLLLFGDDDRKPDYEQAFRWLSEAASRGAPRPTIWLGQMHEDGLATPIDIKKAEELYRSGAERGEIHGCVFLARLHATGKLGTVDESQALRWYEKAIELAPPDADDDPELAEAREYIRSRTNG